jgi:hypothetical protein
MKRKWRVVVDQHVPRKKLITLLIANSNYALAA